MTNDALEGLKVLDFSWVVAGPLLTRRLGTHGATVVRIESSSRPDILRSSRPYKDNIHGVNRSGFFANYNSNKYSITLNLKNPKGLEVARKLIKWSDVVVENFTPGTMKEFGLDYEEIRRINPGAIMVSASPQGEDGPHCKHPGYGIELQSLVGFTALLGWPDRDVVQPFGAISDYVTANFGVVAVLAALDQRRKTGKGAHINVSQLETSLQLLAPLLVYYSATGKEMDRRGNRSTSAAPHGVYRCKGDDRWVAVAIWNDGEWQSFCQAMGKPDLAEDPRFQTLKCRMENLPELEKIVEEWTSGRETEEITRVMWERGLEAAVVQNTEDLFRDPQLKHRHHFWILDHPEMGNCAYEGPPFTLSETPGTIRMPAPCLGEHNEYVCTQILGLSDVEFVELLSEGVLE